MLQVHDIQLVITVAMHLPSNGHFWLGRVEAHCLGLVAHCEGWDTLPITSHNHLETKGVSTRVQRSFPPNRRTYLNSRISSWKIEAKSTDQSHCNILWHHTKHSGKRWSQDLDSEGPDWTLRDLQFRHWPITLQYSMTPYQAFWEWG